MKKQLLLMAVWMVSPLLVQAQSRLEGPYRSEDGKAQVRLTQFNRSLTMSTVSFYSNGAPVNWFFDFTLPAGRDVQVGETINGRVRSLDSYYNCVFDEQAYLQVDSQGLVKIRLPLLTYHRETRSVRQDGGSYYRRQVDWNGWGWVETGYSFPIERWRVISSECVVDQRNWVTNVLSPVTPQPLPSFRK